MLVASCVFLSSAQSMIAGALVAYHSATKRQVPMSGLVAHKALAGEPEHFAMHPLSVTAAVAAAAATAWFPALQRPAPARG